MSFLARFAWAVLGYNLCVILWGAFVRASGSGAGCGSYWPLCNGVVVPQDAGTATLVELTHRITVGLALILMVVLLIWSFRATRRGSPVRLGAVLSFTFFLIEGGIGAGLVLLEKVGEDSSLARAGWLAGHLLNTFLLLACLTLTAWWASGGSPIRTRGVERSAWLAGSLLVATLLVGMTGAVTALGDTLFPATSLTHGLQQDRSPAAHFLVRLRVLHPALAVGVGFCLLLAAPVLAARTPEAPRPRPSTGSVAKALGALVPIQWAGGGANVLLLAPIWLQLVHLLLADLLWITLVLLTAHALTDRRRDRKGFRSGLGRDLLAAGSGQ
ncbi:MAG: COX15/CtaA family protein [Gemmatimonadales bacterium]